MKSFMCQNSGIHHLRFTASDIPLQSLSDFRKVSRSPIIRSIRLLAAHATVGSRHLYITSCRAHCAVCALFCFYPPPPQICSERNNVTSKTETENRFWPFPKPKKNRFRRNPVLETYSQEALQRSLFKLSYINQRNFAEKITISRIFRNDNVYEIAFDVWRYHPVYKLTIDNLQL